VTGTATQIQAATFRLNHRFPGQSFDAESGKSQNYFRDYDPSKGGYTTSDPIGLRGGLSTFAYAQSGPITGSDSTGLFICLITPLGPVCGPWLPPGIPTPSPIPGLPSPDRPNLPTLPLPDPITTMCATMPVLCALPILTALISDCLDDRSCSKASPHQLKGAGISDAHRFKTEWGAVPNSRFDICACKDGSIIIKGVGGCGTPGPGIGTDARWK
jgi:RHS repeat-associated protein